MPQNLVILYLNGRETEDMKVVVLVVIGMILFDLIKRLVNNLKSYNTIHFGLFHEEHLVGKKGYSQKTKQFSCCIGFLL